jgi:UDP-GlcNAc:undecaprenyl-phosphate/decaprenyl-phosphate GlcNAc-1-phosphate transferase
MLILLILCFGFAFAACALIVRYGRAHARRYSVQMPQRFHWGHVPRLGGVGMLLGCVVGWAWTVFAPALGIANQIRADAGFAAAVGVVSLFAVGVGSLEDVSQRVAVRYRLLLTVLGAVLAAWILSLSVPRLDLSTLDGLWTMTPWPGVVLAILAVAGLPHAFNLIDGYNGLAGTVAFICCLALGYVALQVGDRQLAALVLVLAGATAGFLVWNYPHGLIFAGDGGAYLWGVVIAVDSILLVQRHAQVSPWFPLLLLIYPVLETLFSIYRKAARGQSPGVADALHFHQLIYRRIVREVFEDDAARRMLARNNRTSPYLWGFAIVTVLPAALFWYSTPLLLLFSAAAVVAYVWAYVSIVRFKVPRWLRRR